MSAGYLFKLRTSILGKYQDKNDIKNVLTYVTHATGAILNAYSKEKAISSNNLCLLNVKKDSERERRYNIIRSYL